WVGPGYTITLISAGPVFWGQVTWLTKPAVSSTTTATTTTQPAPPPLEERLQAKVEKESQLFGTKEEAEEASNNAKSLLESFRPPETTSRFFEFKPVVSGDGGLIPDKRSIARFFEGKSG